MSISDIKSKLLDRLEDGRLLWEDVARECIAEMSTDEVEEMCDTCEYLADEDEGETEDYDS